MHEATATLKDFVEKAALIREQQICWAPARVPCQECQEWQDMEALRYWLHGLDGLASDFAEPQRCQDIAQFYRSFIPFGICGHSLSRGPLSILCQQDHHTLCFLPCFIRPAVSHVARHGQILPAMIYASCHLTSSKLPARSRFAGMLTPLALIGRQLGVPGGWFKLGVVWAGLALHASGSWGGLGLVGQV